MGLFNWNKKIGIGKRDIHNHLLPGVDDGFRKAEDSLEAIKRMAEEGCKQIVFTPHMNPDVYPDESEEHFRQVYDEFTAQIPAEWGVETWLAAEYMIVKDFQDRASSKELLAYKDGSILIEMSYYFKSENLEETVFALNTEGYKPILAHPERYLYMADSLRDFDRLRDMGCRFQMNRLSLSGIYGGESLKIMDYLLSRGMYDFMATDLHTLSQLDRLAELSVRHKIAALLPQE
jgi:protein-tyrosine phosphatase